MKNYYINSMLLAIPLLSKATRIASLTLFIFVFSLSVNAQKAADITIILKATKVTKLKQLQRKLQKNQAILIEKAKKIEKSRGWDSKKKDTKGYLELIGISEKGTPLYYTLDNDGAAKTTKANRLHTGGTSGLNLNGENITLGIWDGGSVYLEHQEWSNNVTNLNFSAANDHATHVAGTMVAKGVDVKAKGMAPKANLRSYNSAGDEPEMANEASNGLLLSNHSYGLDARRLDLQEFGRYDYIARDWDEIQFNAPYYLAVKSAGNDRGHNGAKNGYDVVNGAEASKNALVVAAVEGVEYYTGPSSITMSSFSSWGPTDDGRIKPDISAKGVGTYSASSESSTSYSIKYGTSMATPNVTGSLALVQQHYHNTTGSYMKSATVKALAIATAEEAGDTPGPDARFGWGLLNVEKAANAITTNGTMSLIEELQLSNSNSYVAKVHSNGSQPITIAIAWTDRAGILVQGIDNRAAMLINDLDVRVRKGGVDYTPWKLDPVYPSNAATKGDNNRDNIERINIGNVGAGEYTITVTHKGSLVGGTQDFSLVVTGASKNIAEPCAVLAPTGLRVADITGEMVTVLWDDVSTASSYDYRYRVSGTSTWTVVNTNYAVDYLKDLNQETTYDVQVRSKCGTSTSPYTAQLSFTTPKTCISTAPQNIHVVSISNDNTVVLEWDAITGSSEYKVELGFGTPLYPTTNRVTFKVSGGLYYINISATCQDGGTSPTARFELNTPKRVPTTPTHFTASATTETSVAFNWNASTNERGDVISYNIYQNDPTNLITNVSGTNTTITGLSPNTTYEFYIRASTPVRSGSSYLSIISYPVSVTTLGSSEPCNNPSLVAHYSFDNISGNSITDESSNGHTGTLNGATIATGKIGNALDFDGGNDYVDIGNFNVSGNGITLAAWIKADDFGTSDARIISKAVGVQEYHHTWMLSTIKNGGRIKPRFRLRTQGLTTTLIGAQNLTAGVWYHITATYDGAKMRVFVNGVEKGNRNKSGSITATNATIRIGDNPVGSRYFDGLIDEVHIFDKALSSTEIIDLKNGVATSRVIANAGNDVTINLRGSTTLSGSGGGSYKWSPATGLSDVNIANPIASPSVTTTYTLTVTKDGCSDIDEVTVTVEGLSPPTNLTATNTTETSTKLSWQHAEYLGMSFDIYQNNVLIKTLGTTTTTIRGLSANTNYTFTIIAKQDNGQAVIISEPSSPVSVTTLGSSDPCNNPSLVARYSFDNISGNSITDESGNGHTGTLYGATIAVGKIGNALDFDGGNDYVGIGNFNVSGNSITLAAWIKADDFGTHDARIISKAVGVQEYHHTWMLSTIKNGGKIKPRFRLQTKGFTSTLIGTQNLTAGVWYHITATYDGAKMRVFVNGLEKGNRNKSGRISASNAFIRIGDNPVGSRYFDGLIDEVHIFDKALSSAEIISLKESSGCSDSDNLDTVESESVNHSISFSDIKVYPNPVSNYLNVNIPTAVEGKLIMTLTSITGKVILRKEIKSNEQVDFSRFANGLYLLNLRDNINSSQYKIIKQ